MTTKCSDCGYDHQDQVTDFPNNSRVIARHDIPEWESKPVPAGTIGTVTGHCDDGRAIIQFKGFAIHTFHHAKDFISLQDAKDKRIAELEAAERAAYNRALEDAAQVAERTRTSDFSYNMACEDIKRKILELKGA